MPTTQCRATSSRPGRLTYLHPSLSGTSSGFIALRQEKCVAGTVFVNYYFCCCYFCKHYAQVLSPTGMAFFKNQAVHICFPKGSVCGQCEGICISKLPRRLSATAVRTIAIKHLTNIVLSVCIPLEGTPLAVHYPIPSLKRFEVPTSLTLLCCPTGTFSCQSISYPAQSFQTEGKYFSGSATAGGFKEGFLACHPQK